MYAQDEVVDLLVAEKKTTFGGLCYNGSCRMIEVNGAAGEKMFNTWHIFGDPSLQIRTDNPVTLAVENEAQVAAVASAFDVVVYGRRDALCAIYHDGILYGAAYTDLNGSASITLSEHLPVGETVTLTVTAYNALPHVSTILVIPASGAYLTYDYYHVDDAAGNGNGLVEAGESIVLGVGLVNIGSDEAGDIAASISTSDGYVTITDPVESYGTIPSAGGAGYSPSAFSFDVSGDAPDGHVASMDLSIVASGGYATLLHFEIPIGISPMAVCGDIDGSGGELLDISDLIYLVDYMFNGGPPSPVMAAANVDGKGGDLLDIVDLMYVVNYMFHHGAAPVCDL